MDAQTVLGSFIGREDDVARLHNLLLAPAIRWVTLTGPGGVGKTRLASELARDLADEWRDGAAFIPLDAVRLAEGLLPAIARELGLHPGGRAIPEMLTEHFRKQHLLLVLDNFEQIANAAPEVAALLDAESGVTVLATSRVPLWLPHERVYDVSPLETDDRSGASAAMRLFLDRAGTGWGSEGELELTAASRQMIAELCRRLDGLPLAIELAAARSTIFSPAALLQRLDRRLPILTGGRKELPERHQTIAACIAWSYEQLPDDARLIFRCLGIVVGGCSRDAIGDIALASDHQLSQERIDAALMTLIEQSLIRKQIDEQEGDRFAMLETIRAYAVDRLQMTDDFDVVRAAHARSFLAAAAADQPQMSGSGQRTALDRIQREYGNLRAATAWLIEQPESTATELQAVDGLVTYWLVRGPQRDGITLLDQLMARTAPVTHERAILMNLAGTLARQHRDFRHAAYLHDESFALAELLGDRRVAAKALHNRGVVASQTGDYPRAISCFEGSQALFRELDDQKALALSVYNLGVIAERQGEFARASELLEQSLNLHQRLGDTDRVAMSLYFLGLVTSGQGDISGALQLHQEAVALWRELDSRQTIGHALFYVGRLLRIQGESAAAVTIFLESLDLNRDEGDRWHAVKCLLELIVIAAGVGAMETAARFHQSAISLHDWRAIPFRQDERNEYEGIIAQVEAAKIVLTILPPDIDAIIADAEALRGQVEARYTALHQFQALSKRELEMVQMLLEGQSDRQIGDQLSISHRTVMKHVSNLLAKLDLNSRAEVPGFVARYHLNLSLSSPADGRRKAKRTETT